MTRFIDRPLVYVAGPYASSPVENTHHTIKVADGLHDTGLVVCHVPHLTLLWHIICPHGDTEEQNYWYEYDLVALKRADALLRLPGPSRGADAEVEFAIENKVPCFYSTDVLLDWAKGR